MMKKQMLPWQGRLSQLLADPIFAWDAEVGRWFAPNCNILEDDQGYEISMDVPGLTGEDVKVEFHEGRLHVSGERNFERDQEGVNFHRVERHYGKFERSFGLPKDVNGEQLTAECQHGVLTIRAPKVAAVQPKRIDVK